MTILKVKELKQFDVNNQDHLQSFTSFLTHDRWGSGGCPFNLEHPWNNVPDMIKDKIARHYLKVEEQDCTPTYINEETIST